VVRTASKVLRRRKLLTRLGLRRGSDPIDVDTLVSRTVPPDEAAELRAIYTLVESLPVDVRVPLLLRRVEGMALEEIALATGKSLATVKRKLADGERRLSRKMNPPGARS
jgi:RNA polymerase sigma-70 factor (ECF subfamily)